RNFLLGAEGDAANVILAAAGHNLRLLRAWLAWLLVFLLSLAVAVHNCRPATQLRPSVVWTSRSSRPTNSPGFSGSYGSAEVSEFASLAGSMGRNLAKSPPD